MNDTMRFAVFLTIVLGVWTLMHLYAGLRLAGVLHTFAPGMRRWTWLGLGVLWVIYPLGRFLDRAGLKAPGVGLEWLGALWMGVLFLLLAAQLAADVTTGFGLAGAALAGRARAVAAGVGLVLAGVAIAQGLRAPAVEAREVTLPGLPAARDGLRVVQVSDLHLGTLLGERWLRARIAEVQALQPDLIVVTGDLIDGDSARVEELLPLLRTLRAPLGVLAVTGNHEFYAGIDRSIELFKAAGFEVLRDRHVTVVPGLIVAGVDDLTARRQFDLNGDPFAAALDGRGEGATILLSHTPWRAAQAAARGVGLMLSGHTHDGQIWPFGYLVRLQYPYVGGSYDVNGMALLVSRGTGTWGPRMRLFSRSEITLITLRAKA
jgi:hypothetical protein